MNARESSGPCFSRFDSFGSVSLIVWPDAVAGKARAGVVRLRPRFRSLCVSIR